MGKIINQDLPGDPPAPSAGQHVIYTKAGGVFVRSPSGVVGPLSAGGTVNNLQDAYDGGASIAVVAGTPIQVTGAATGDVLRSETSGSGSAIYAETTGAGNGVTIYASPAATGNALSSLANGTGSAVYAETNGDGNGVTAYANNATASNRNAVQSIVDTTATNSTALSALVLSTAVGAKGLTVDLTVPGSQGNGIEVDIDSTGVGISVEQSGVGNAISSVSNGTGSAVYAETNAAGNGVTAYAAPAATGNAISSYGSGTGSSLYAETNGLGNGVTVYSNNAGAKNAVAVFVDLSATGTKAIYASVAPGHPVNVIEVADTSPATVFAVDSAGNTTTPSVVFGGSRITVEGDTGVAGAPLDPRVSLTSGSTALGTLKRTYLHRSEGSGAPAILDLDGVSALPTVVSLASYGGWTVYLPDPSKYPNGTEIIVLNESGGAFNITSNPAPGGSDIRILGGSPASGSPQNVVPGAGRRFMAFAAASTDTNPVGAWWVVTGTI